MREAMTLSLRWGTGQGSDVFCPAAQPEQLLPPVQISPLSTQLVAGGVARAGERHQKQPQAAQAAFQPQGSAGGSAATVQPGQQAHSQASTPA